MRRPGSPDAEAGLGEFPDKPGKLEFRGRGGREELLPTPSRSEEQVVGGPRHVSDNHCRSSANGGKEDIG